MENTENTDTKPESPTINIQIINNDLILSKRMSSSTRNIKINADMMDDFIISPINRIAIYNDPEEEK